MAAPQVIDDLEDFVREDGRNVIHQQAGFVQNTLAFSLPMEEDYDVPPASKRLARPVALKKGVGKETRVNVVYGGAGSFGTYDDNAARPEGVGVTVSGANKLPVLVGDTLKFSLSEIELADGSDESTIDKFITTAKAHGSMVGAYLARSIINPIVDEPAADVAAGATTMTVQVVNGYIVGAKYEVRLDSTGALIGTFRVADISIAFDLTAVITFESALTFTIDVSEHSIYLLGQGDSGKRLGSIADATDSTVALYGLNETTQFPAGLSTSIGGAFSNADAKKMHSIIVSQGNVPSHWLTSPHGRDRILNAQQDNVRFIAGDMKHKWDPFNDSAVPEFNGTPVIACPQADDSTIDLGDFDFIEFREHVPYGPRQVSGAGKAEMGKGALLESEDSFSYKLRMHGFYSTVITKRRAFGRLTNVTS